MFFSFIYRKPSSIDWFELFFSTHHIKPSKQTCFYLIYWLCTTTFNGNHYPGQPACFHCTPFGTKLNYPLHDRRSRFSPFFPPSVNITRRSLFLTKGNHWRFGTQAETPVLYNCPEMRSCGGAWGSELTTNIITVWAVEEVGVFGGEFAQPKPTIAFCMFVLWGFMLRRPFILPAGQPGYSHWLNLPPLFVRIVGVSTSIWDAVKRKDTAVPPLLCTYFPRALFPLPRTLSTTSQTCQQRCGPSGNLRADILSRPLSRFMKLTSASTNHLHVVPSVWTHSLCTHTALFILDSHCL